MTSEEKLTKAITPKVLEDFYNQKVAPFLNGAAHTGFTPIGTIISVMGTTAPQNYLSCDGTAYNISDYPELASYFNAQFGSSNFFGGNGTTTFAVPDLRGEFLRGTGTNSHANQGSGANVGVHQDGTEHTFLSKGNVSNSLSVIGIATVSGVDIPNVDKMLSRDLFNGNATITTTKSTEWSMKHNSYTSRPTNTSVLYCIATKNIYVDARFDYSLEEKVVGTWMGKPLYQKTISGTMGSTASSGKTIDISSINRDVAFISNAFIGWKDGNNSGYINLIAKDTNDTNTYALNCFVQNSSILITCSGLVSSIFNNMPYYITLQYTKTTD